MKKEIKACSYFRDLHEGFFQNKSALSFCQLHFLMGDFVEKSKISTENSTFVFVDAPESKAKGLIEFIAWNWI